VKHIIASVHAIERFPLPTNKKLLLRF
jgi:hypothetical protein